MNFYDILFAKKLSGSGGGITPTGTLNIVENGLYDVTDYASVNVDVSFDPPTYRTVLYTDGTFIINESSRDQAANEALHGAATNIYVPFDPNGDTAIKRYEFAGAYQIPWYSQKNSITRIEVGSVIAPLTTAYWFSSTKCSTIDISKLDTSDTTDMQYMFGSSYYLTSIDLSGLNTSSVTNMFGMFSGCEALTSIDASTFDTSSVTNMNSMFFGCNRVTSVDMSGFDTSLVTNMDEMFRNCSLLKTIYASPTFVVDQVTASSDMFYNMSTKLVGGAGTVWSSSYTDKARAKIDGGTSDPGYFTAKGV